jgi:hypothetical protein
MLCHGYEPSSKSLNKTRISKPFTGIKKERVLLPVVSGVAQIGILNKEKRLIFKRFLL